MKTALIYAAGFGTRMGALTKSQPKPMLDLNGRPLIDHVVEMMRGGGVEKFHINTHYLSEQISNHFNNDPSVFIHHEIAEPLETGGTLKSIADELPEAIFTMNSDALFSGANPLNLLRDAWDNNLDALMMMVPVAYAQNYAGKGDFNVKDGQISWRDVDGVADYVYTGLQIIRPSLAQTFAEDIFSTKLIWTKLIEKGSVRAVIYPDQWIDIGTIQALEAARKMTPQGRK